MKIIRSNWFLMLLGALLFMGVQVWMILGFVAQATKPDPMAVIRRKQTLSYYWDLYTPEIDALKADLKKQIAAVKRRQQDLNAYDKRLQAEKAEIMRIRDQVTKMRTELSNSIVTVQASEQKNLKTLAATYSNLSPAAAVAIFQQLDDDTVVKILSFMKADAVGQILQQMATTKDDSGQLVKRAAAISNKLRLLKHG